MEVTQQCQFFVLRKKRLCRMTVRPGRHYCGEHDPQTHIENGQVNIRVPCPNDPKHTCYKNKLEKHLAICNARPCNQPPYIVPNINSTVKDVILRKPLCEISREKLMAVIEKVNILFEKHLKDNISEAKEQPIHHTVIPQFTESDRTESSLRHLRQASSLLWIAELEGLVSDRTCYVELGAGKGQLSYYACRAWCESNSRVLLVDRASLRHKRDNKLPSNSAERIRADLAHLALDQVGSVQECMTVVGFAKHLCGVAMDYALRCLTSNGVLSKCRGAVVATCCHHRCEISEYVGHKHLQKLGIDNEELNIILGVVSWATCGDGRSREQRTDNHKTTSTENEPAKLTLKEREQIGRRAKTLVDWGRVMYLKEKGFNARLCYYVPTSVSLENICIIAKS